MEKFIYPLVDYRTFLSDIGTGIIALISVIIIIFKQHPDIECNSYAIREIHNIIYNSDLKINVIEPNTILITLIIVLFIAPLIGFIINASSYLFLNWFLKSVSDTNFFNYLLKSIGVKNYHTIEYELEDNKKRKQNDFNYSKFFDGIRINLRAKTDKNIGSQYDRILGGLNMCRNCTFIIIIDLYIILYIYSFYSFLLLLLYSLIFYSSCSFIKSRHYSIKRILFLFSIYLFLLPILTFWFIYIKYNFEMFYILELTLLTEFFLSLTIFISGFFIVYNNNDIYMRSKIYLKRNNNKGYA